MSIQSLLLATLAISALGANLKGTTEQGVEIAPGQVAHDMVDLLGHDCSKFDQNSGWKVVMGQNTDYYKPKAGETLCSALRSTNKFLWSATQNGNYVAPAPYPGNAGGSAAWWPKNNVPGSYSKPATGKCENTGGETMTSLAACKTAATKLGLGRVEVGNSKGWSHVPPGCSMWGSVVHFNYKKTTRSCDYSASKYCICKEMTGDNRKYLPFWSTKTTSGGSRYEKYKNGCCHNTKSDKAAWGRKFKIYIIQEGTKCLVLPMSMNGGRFPRGCPGAVWSNSKPAHTYCNGKGGKYPWWRDCCQWEGGSCKPKPVAAEVALKKIDSLKKQWEKKWAQRVTTAEAARDSALTAKTTAVAARDSALTAKATAEAARTSAVLDKATAEAARDIALKKPFDPSICVDETSWVWCKRNHDLAQL